MTLKIQATDISWRTRSSIARQYYTALENETPHKLEKKKKVVKKSDTFPVNQNFPLKGRRVRNSDIGVTHSNQHTPFNPASISTSSSDITVMLILNNT